MPGQYRVGNDIRIKSYVCAADAIREYVRRRIAQAGDVSIAEDGTVLASTRPCEYNEARLDFIPHARRGATLSRSIGNSALAKRRAQL